MEELSLHGGGTHLAAATAAGATGEQGPHGTVVVGGRRRERGLLRWSVVALLIAGCGCLLLMQLRRAKSIAPQLEGAAQPGAAAGRDGDTNVLRVKLRIARSQVATLELMRHDTEPPTLVPFFSGYVAAPDEERGRVEFLLVPAPGTSSEVTPISWTMKLVAEDGATVVGSSAELGPLIPVLGRQGSGGVEIEAGSVTELMLTGPYPDAETNGISPRVPLALHIRSQDRTRVTSRPVESTVVSLGTTNWMAAIKAALAVRLAPTGPVPEVLAHQWRRSQEGPETTNWISFTVTAVEYRRAEDGRWLALDHVTDEHGDCERVFRTVGIGFKPVTRTSEFRVEPKGSPPVHHQRVEWQLPDAVKESEALSYRDTLARELVGKSVRVSAGEERPIFRLPIGKIGELSAAVGATRVTPSSP